MSNRRLPFLCVYFVVTGFVLLYNDSRVPVRDSKISRNIGISSRPSNPPGVISRRLEFIFSTSNDLPILKLIRCSFSSRTVNLF